MKTNKKKTIIVQDLVGVMANKCFEITLSASEGDVIDSIKVLKSYKKPDFFLKSIPGERSITLDCASCSSREITLVNRGAYGI